MSSLPKLLKKCFPFTALGAEETQKRKQDTQIAFRDLWVAGTLGVFFVTIIKNIPIHFNEISLFDANAIFTAEQTLRYGYMFWFVHYFFISNLMNKANNNESTYHKWDLPFDVTQSILAMVSLYFLGFLTSEHKYDFFGIIVANISIAGICAFSYGAFKDGSPKGLNRIRKIAFVITLFSACIAGFLWSEQCTISIIAMIGFLISIIILHLLLILFSYIKVHAESELTPKVDPPAPVNP